MKSFIYRLKDPNTNKTMYVGKTNDPKLREQQHLVSTANAEKAKWISVLRDLGMLPPT